MARRSKTPAGIATTRPRAAPDTGRISLSSWAPNVVSDVDVAGDVLEPLPGVVDRLVRAEFLEPGMPRFAGGATTSAPMLGELHREVSDAAGRRVNEYALTGLHIGGVDQGLPRGKRREGQGRGLDMADQGRLRRSRGRARAHSA